MKFIHFAAACAAFALAACGQAQAPTEEAPAAVEDLLSQVNRMPAEQQPVFAYQQLAAYQQGHPESLPVCAAVRATEARGVVPENVDPASPYAAHVGSSIYSVQCGALISATAYDPREHWLVAFAPGAAEATVVNCADAQGIDQCPRQIPTVAAAEPATPAP